VGCLQRCSFMNWDDLRPGDELVEKPGNFRRHFIVLSRCQNIMLLYSFTLDELVNNDLEEIHTDDLHRLEEMYSVTRHA
jgi:hypothetical protein